MPSFCMTAFHQARTSGHQWNSFYYFHSAFNPRDLPIALRNIDSYPAFRRALKSHLFSCAFSSQLLSHIFTEIVMHSRPSFVDWALEHLVV